MGGDTTKKSPLRGPSGMKAEHLKWWLEDSRKKEREDAVSDQETTTEGTTAGTNGTRGRVQIIEDRREPAEASDWEKVLDLIQTTFGRGGLRRRTCGRWWF